MFDISELEKIAKSLEATGDNLEYLTKDRIRDFLLDLVENLGVSKMDAVECVSDCSDSITAIMRQIGKYTDFED